MTPTERLALAQPLFLKANNLRILLRVNHDSYLRLSRGNLHPDIKARLDADLLALRNEIDEAEALAESYFPSPLEKDVDTTPSL